MKNLFFTLVTITLLSFNAMGQNENISGSIYIKLIDVHNIFNMQPDKILNQFRDSLSNPNHKYDKNHPNLDRQASEYFKFLDNNNFFRKPHFKLKLDSGKIINVFVEEAEYSKLEKELKGFDKEKERINLNFEGVKKSDGFFKELDQAIYYANKITFVEKIPGETDWDK